MGIRVKKKKPAFYSSRRKRDKARLSFFFLLFFIGLFGVFLIVETFSETRNLVENDENFSKESNIVIYDYKTEENVRIEPKKVLQPFQMVKIEKNFPFQVVKSTNSLPNKSSARIQPLRKKFENPSVQSDWQSVSGSSDKFYVYSAYYVKKPGHKVRVIGAARTKTGQHVQCRYYDQVGNHYSTVDGTIRTIRENWNLRYSAIFVICEIPPENIVPKYVSVMPTSSPLASASNILRIQQHLDDDLRTESTIDFSTCVKPTFDYDNVLEFLEWIEFHKLMGVKHFTFYNHTIGKKVGCLLRQVYQDQVTVLPWTLPFVSQKEIRTEGLFAALNDCVYRHRGISKYLILVDLDEMIVPRRGYNYSQLIEQLDTLSNKKKIGAYSLQNAFFYLQWPDVRLTYNLSYYPLAEAVSQQLLMLRKTRRRSRLHPHKQRSKYICDPEKVVEAGNHFIWEMMPGYNTLSTPSHLATLHHYRVCEFGGNQCVKTPSVMDKSILPFGESLTVSVAQNLENFSEKCHSSVSTILDKMYTTP